FVCVCFFFQAEDGIRDFHVTGVQTCALPILTKEQVESLGGRFLVVEGAEEVKTEGGYAREVSADFLARQKQLIEDRIKDADVVITTALVMGKRSPLLVTEDMVKSMKAGSVIVDMAVESGGNCELSEFNQTVVRHGVTIIGESNLP